ncbi:MAG: Asp-tRNA(Asn)/Glu-tRNA(Gln) amidotransferase subunit GatC [Candidatus Omnitrophota bacterium]
MSIDKKTVEAAAHLARLELDAQESDKLSGQLEHILAFIDKLSSINTDNIAPTSHILALNNVLRKDEPRACLPVEKALKNAPGKEGSFFVVPRIIE